MFVLYFVFYFFFFFFKQKTAYEMRISDWSSDVCSSDLFGGRFFDLAVEPGEKFAMRLRVVKFAEVFEFGIRSVAVPELSVEELSRYAVPIVDFIRIGGVDDFQ